MDKKSLISHKIFLSQRYAVQLFPYLIGKRHLVWFTTKKACNDAKQLDEQNLTIYGANYLKETGNLKDIQHSGWPRKMSTCKNLYCITSSRRNRYQKRPKNGLLFAWCIWNEILFWNGEESSCLNVSQRRLSTDTLIFKRHRETHKVWKYK